MKKILEFLERHDAVFLTTHIHPDADGMGAELLFHRLLTHLGKEAWVVNHEAAPERFSFIDRGHILETWEEGRHRPAAIRSGLCILDTADEFNIGSLRERLPLFQEVVVIDHHEPNRRDALEGYIDPGASSACELVLDLINALKIPLDKDSAEAAFTGICYDTVFFGTPKTGARTFRAALELVEAGVVPSEICAALQHNESAGALLLRKAVLSTLELRHGGQVAVQVLTREDLRATGGRFEDAESFVNMPLTSRDVEVSVLVKENDDGKVRCSLRSKGRLPVSKIAQSFGGGGHTLAAGFSSPRGVAETRALILERVEAGLDGLGQRD